MGSKGETTVECKFVLNDGSLAGLAPNLNCEVQIKIKICCSVTKL